MIWQDYAIALLQLAFVPALVPSLLGRAKPALWTSLPTAVILWCLAATSATLGLWFSVGGTVLIAAGWTVLAVQVRRRT